MQTGARARDHGARGIAASLARRNQFSRSVAKGV
jgi:hypothetical protein